MASSTARSHTWHNDVMTFHSSSLDFFRAPCILLIIGTSSCATKSPAPASAQDSIAEVVYEGIGTDEALIDLLLAKAVSGKSARVTFPAANQAVPSSPLPTFTWATPTACHPCRPWQRGRPWMVHSESATAAAQRLPTWPTWPTWLQWEGTAHAHGAASNGTAYLIVFATANNPKLLRVFTTKNSYVPLGDAWERLKTAKGPLNMRITAGTFEENRLIAGTGPFESEAVSFTITGS